MYACTIRPLLQGRSGLLNFGFRKSLTFTILVWLCTKERSTILPGLYFASFEFIWVFANKMCLTVTENNIYLTKGDNKSFKKDKYCASCFNILFLFVYLLKTIHVSKCHKSDNCLYLLSLMMSRPHRGSVRRAPTRVHTRGRPSVRSCWTP